MIEVVLSNGDRAEAEDPESALVAARTLVDARILRVQGERDGLRASFYVEGTLVRNLDWREIR